MSVAPSPIHSVSAVQETKTSERPHTDALGGADARRGEAGAVDRSIDQKARALELLEAARERAEGSYGDGIPPDLLLKAAVAYSNLAIAEGQERVAEELRKSRSNSDIRERLTERCNRWIDCHRKGEEEARKTNDLEGATQHQGVRESFEDVLKEVEGV